MRKFALTLPAALLITACAKSPEAIEPVSMGNTYAGITCAQAQALSKQESQRLTTLSEAQRKAATNDAVGVFLIGVPVSSLNGNDRAGTIATTKGKLAALDARLASCG